MEQFSQETHRTVDEKTADEALKLAARMQGEQGRRVSVDELHRTADEAGIDREYLAAALDQVTRQTAPMMPDGRRRRLRVLIALCFACVFASLLAQSSGSGGHDMGLVTSMFASMAVSAIVVRSILLRHRRQ